MKKVDYKKRLEDIYYSLMVALRQNTNLNELTLEEFFEKFPYACFYGNTRFYFSPESTKPQKRVCDTYWNASFQELQTYYSKEDYYSDKIAYSKNFYDIRTYRKIFPFIPFSKFRSTRWSSEWFESKLLYESLPSRINYINQILKDIE